MEGVGISRGFPHSVLTNSRMCTQVQPELFPQFVESEFPGHTTSQAKNRDSSPLALEAFSDASVDRGRKA